MRKFLLPLCIFLLIIFSQINFAQTISDSEEYVVYSVLLEQKFSNEKNSQLVIEELTSVDDFQPTLKLKKRLSPLTKETIADFITKNTTGHQLTDKFNLEVEINILSGNVKEELFKNLNAKYYEWEKVFGQKYPAAGGTIISLSRVGFNANKTQALILVGYQCGWTCGEGSYVLLMRKQGQWKIKKKHLSWIS